MKKTKKWFLIPIGIVLLLLLFFWLRSRQTRPYGQGLLENAITAACGEGTVSDQARRLAAALDVRTLHRQYAAIRKAREYTLSNVSPAAVCGYLEWVLR